MTRRFKHNLSFPLLLLLLACSGSSRSVVTGAEDTFTNPLLTSAPDPWVEQKDDWYYVTHTTGKELRLYRTKNMSDLPEAEAKTVWTPPPSGMNAKQIWAPEIHYLQGKWYFYYAADDGKNENHRMWVLENEHEDPFEGTWEDKGELELPGDKWAIDGTVFEHDGDLYFLWSGWEGDINIRQNIYITTLQNPWTASEPRVLISKPEYQWELVGGTPTINEAPQYMKRGDKHFIIYSASGCWTDDYTLGMLSADAEADLLSPASWKKHPEPVFRKDSVAGAFGPGHNSFFTSPDGKEDWIVYHANPQPGQGCKGQRSMRMQKFSWTKEGVPHFGKPAALGAPVELPSGEN